MAMDIIYTVLLIKLGSNALYRSTNASSLQGMKNNSNTYTILIQLSVLVIKVSYLPGWTSALCFFVKEHKTTEVDSKLQQHSQHCIQVEDVG